MVLLHPVRTAWFCTGDYNNVWRIDVKFAPCLRGLWPSRDESPHALSRVGSCQLRRSLSS